MTSNDVIRIGKEKYLVKSSNAERLIGHNHDEEFISAVEILLHEEQCECAFAFEPNVLRDKYSVDINVAEQWLEYVRNRVESNVKRIMHSNLKAKKKQKLITEISKLNDCGFSQFQAALFADQLLSEPSSMQDMSFFGEEIEHAAEAREIQVLHTLNFLTKRQKEIINHDNELKVIRKKRKRKFDEFKVERALDENDDNFKGHTRLAEDLDDEQDKFRDQGYTKPKILILLPTRILCLRFMKVFLEIFQTKSEHGKGKVKNLDKFFSEFCNPVYDDNRADDDNRKASESYDERDLKNGVHPLIQLDRDRYTNAKPRSLIYLADFETNISKVDVPFETFIDEQQKDAAAEEEHEPFRMDFESFYLGLNVKEKQMILYTNFYKSDMIVASPLGLRLATNLTMGSGLLVDFSSENNLNSENKDLSKNDIEEEELDEFGVSKLAKKKTEDEQSEGSETEAKEVDADFLSSIEMCLVDRADLVYMQNPQHFVDILNAMFNKPQKLRTDIDFARLRQYFLEDRSVIATRAQLILMSRYATPELLAIFKSKKSLNGSTSLRPTDLSPILDVSSTVTLQKFTYHDPTNLMAEDDARFNYFNGNILKDLIRNHKSQVGLLIVLPSYLDFVRVRNKLQEVAQGLNRVYTADVCKVKVNTSQRRRLKAKEEAMDTDKANLTIPGLFSALNEYSSTRKITKIRGDFQRRKFDILLVTERFHYYYRYVLSGVKQVMFYSLPLNAEFFMEFVRMVENDDKLKGSHEVKALIGVSDSLKLERIIGTKQAVRIMKDTAKQAFTIKSD